LTFGSSPAFGHVSHLTISAKVFIAGMSNVNLTQAKSFGWLENPLL
jgi:hypothetical protein